MFPKYFWSDYLFKSISRHDIEGVYIYYIILRGINDSAESDSTLSMTLTRSFRTCEYISAINTIFEHALACMSEG